MEVQGVLEDNLYLKKNLQVARHQLDLLQQQLADERTLNQQLLERNTVLSDTHAQLQRRTQLQAAQQGRETAALGGQVDELKELIERKQQQLEEFQLRIIPSLDQDMLRVKLITEMEGPYQETLEKRDRQIIKLKERLAQAERRAALSEMQLETREKDYRREVEEIKRYYQAENSKLSREASAAMTRKEGKSFEKELFKGQRKELEQLRFTIQLQSQNESELRKQMSSLKIEREKLLLQLGELNEQRALQAHLSSDNQEMRALKQEKIRLEEEVARRVADAERAEKRFRKQLAEAKKGEEEVRKRNIEERELWERERETAREEISKLKLEANRARDRAERQQEDLQTLALKLKNSERELAAKTADNSRMRESIAQLELTIRQQELAKRQKLSLSKHFEATEEKPSRKEEVRKEESKGNKEDKKENDGRRTNIIVNKDDRRREETASLEKANAKLREKLEMANQKIVQLLKDKAANAPQRQMQQPLPGSNSRDRAFSNIQLESMRPRTDKAFLLEYRDSSFTPLVPPTIFTQPY